MADVVLKLVQELATNGISYVPATRAVVAGHDLESSGNRTYGSNVHVGTVPDVEHPILADVRTGTMLHVGQCERFWGRSLVCERNEGLVRVLVRSDDQRVVSRELSCADTGADSYDEAEFIWLGPVEQISYPWSDNAPPECQVVTVAALRTLAATHQVAHAAGRFAKLVEAHVAASKLASLSPTCARQFPDEHRDLVAAVMALSYLLFSSPHGIETVTRNVFDQFEPLWTKMCAAIGPDVALPAARQQAEELAMDYFRGWILVDEEKRRRSRWLGEVFLFIRNVAL